jgi:HTH-type transcriptional regulator, sugar sensing transcriptional regulator
LAQGARDRALSQLRKLGLSGYEAKVYTALIAADVPLTGYEVAKRSGVPRSTVYEVLGNLASKGIASEARPADSSQVYVGLAPRALLTRLRRDFDDSMTALSIALPALRLPVQANTTHHIGGLKLVQERALDMIDGAQFELYLSVWPDMLDGFRLGIQRACDRGVDTSVVCFGDAEPVGHFYKHLFSAPDVVLERIGCGLMVLASDRNAVLISGTVGDETWGVYSEDPAVVLVAVEYVRHDIAIHILIDRVGADIVGAFWSSDEALARLATGKGAPGLPTVK